MALMRRGATSSTDKGDEEAPEKKEGERDIFSLLKDCSEAAAAAAAAVAAAAAAKFSKSP